MSSPAPKGGPSGGDSGVQRCCGRSKPGILKPKPEESAVCPAILGGEFPEPEFPSVYNKGAWGLVFRVGS
jgi:hypothetical protein